MESNSRMGFALPAVLAVTGVVTLIFLVAITALASLTAEARSTRERLRFLESALTAEATLEYLATTEPMSGQALNLGGPRTLNFGEDDMVAPPSGEVTAIYLDGRPYQIDTEGLAPRAVVASLRDQAGMINLAILSDDQLRRVGDMLGMPPALSRYLRPLLTDYIDPDDLETLGGAERARYRGNGPANRFLMRPAELLSILGMREAVTPRLWRAISEDLAVDSQRASVNLNTASAQTLQILFGITDQQAQAAIRARDRAQFLSLNDFIAASGANIVDDGESLLTFPSGPIIYTLKDTRSPWRYRARLLPTPLSDERPFWVDQTEMTEGPESAMANKDADRFPYPPR